MPQDEMSIAVNPLDTGNVFGGANDYRLGWGSSGFYVSTDRGRDWNDGIAIFPTPGSYPTPQAPKDHIDGGGDPIALFDRGGTAYYGQIHFERENDTGGIFVNRSTNGGFTWSRPCIPNVAGVCGGNGDPRQPGDGVVTFNPDDDGILNGSVPFDDKPYGTTGRRPAGVAPVCFTPHPAHTPTPCPEGHVGPDRIYITWTRFNDIGSEIMISYSDDRARSWSAAKIIQGNAVFCVGGANGCSDNQGSQPVVNPTNGTLYVLFENFDTPDENQYLLVSSTDGGNTFAGPFFVTPVFDVNYPTTGNNNRPDCAARGQGGGRAVLTNSCFRVNARGAIAVDKRGGAFANDLFVVIADNRNGTRVSTNTDVSLFKSTDGGVTWAGPTRVNDDPSSTPASRDCGRGGRPAMSGRRSHRERPVVPVAGHQLGRLGARHLAGPAARHDLAGGCRRVADKQDQAGQLHRLVLGRPVPHDSDRSDHALVRSTVRPSECGDHHAADGSRRSAGRRTSIHRSRSSRSGTSGSPTLRTTGTTASAPASSAATTRTSSSTRTTMSGRCGRMPETGARRGRRPAGTRRASSRTPGPTGTGSPGRQWAGSRPVERLALLGHALPDGRRNQLGTRRREGRPPRRPSFVSIRDCAASGFRCVALLVGAVRRANERAREDGAEAERLALLAEPAELVGMHPAVDLRVLRRGLEVLADRDDVDAVLRAGRASSSTTSSFVSPRPTMIPDFVSTG